MGKYLHAKSLWQYVRANIPCPTDAVPGGTAAAPTLPTAEAITETVEKQQAWAIKNDEANGLICTSGKVTLP